MAKLTVDYSGFDRIEATFDHMSRGSIRRIVEAGAKAATQEMKKAVQAAHHVRTGDMLQSVGPGEYHETLNGGYMAVYPQGTDQHGVANAMKAFVINYGRGRKKRNGKMGDQFITGREAATEAIVKDAMQAEADKIIDEINR